MIFSDIFPHSFFIYFILFYFTRFAKHITDINKTNTLQNLHTIRAGTNHRDNLQSWGPLQ